MLETEGHCAMISYLDSLLVKGPQLIPQDRRIVTSNSPSYVSLVPPLLLIKTPHSYHKINES